MCNPYRRKTEAYTVDLVSRQRELTTLSRETLAHVEESPLDVRFYKRLENGRLRRSGTGEPSRTPCCVLAQDITPIEIQDTIFSDLCGGCVRRLLVSLLRSFAPHIRFCRGPCTRRTVVPTQLKNM